MGEFYCDGCARYLDEDEFDSYDPTKENFCVLCESEREEPDDYEDEDAYDDRMNEEDEDDG